MNPHKTQNILEEEIEANLYTNNRAKLIFLQGEKERLEIAIEQLRDNNVLLRTINQQIISQEKYSEGSLLNSLNQQNALLQTSYSRVLKQNEDLSSSLLLLQQVMDEAALENQAILKEYQSKIIELRRAIQSKEINIQELEKKLNYQQNLIVPPNNITVLFFNEIEELKKVIDSLTSKSRALQQENNTLRHKNQRLERRINLLQALTLKSKLMYEQFKHYYGEEEKRRHSAPKKDTFLPLDYNQSPWSKKLNEGQTKQTREYSQCQPSKIDHSYKMLLYKESLEIERLKVLLSQTVSRLLSQKQVNRRITLSYSEETKRMGELNKELNYYKQCTQDMLKILTHRKCGLSRSQEKSRDDRIIRSIQTPPERTYISERKQFWLSIQKNIKPERLKILQIKKKRRFQKRSISCMPDYRTRNADAVEKYLMKKVTTDHKKKKMMEEIPLEGINDLTLLMNDQMGGDISIICSSAEPPGKTSYSQWKKTQRKTALPDLTVLQENVL